MYTRRESLRMGSAAACAIFMPGNAPAEPTLARIIEQHTIARGGAAALDRIHAKLVDLAIAEKGQTFDARYQCVADPAWRIDIYAGGKHVFCEGLDEHGPWLWPGGAAAPRDGVPDARRTGIQGIEFHLYGLHCFTKRGHTIALDAPQEVDGVSYHVLRVTMRDAYETFLFINPETWLIDRRRDERAPHPDVDSTRKFLEKRFSDYRPVSGVMTAFLETQVDLISGETINTSTVRDMAYNHAYAPSTFERNFVAS